MSDEDPFEGVVNAAFANSASAINGTNLSEATLSDLLLHSPTNSPTKLSYPRSLTSGLIAAGCIPSSTLVCTLPSPTPATPKIGPQSLELLPTPKIGPQVSVKSISQSETEELSFADQFLARGPSSSAPKRIRLIDKEEEEATSSFSVKAAEEAQCSSGSKASPFTFLFKEASLFQYARTQSNESNASNLSDRSYFSMGKISAAAPSFTGEAGGAKAPAGK
jgi:hypothetical protein